MYYLAFVFGMTQLHSDIISGIISGIVSGIAVGIALWFWQRKNRRLANSLNIRKMYNDILISGKQDRSGYFLQAIAQLFDYIAISKKRKELEEEEYKDW